LPDVIAKKIIENPKQVLFDDFVADSKYAAILYYGRPYISYIVLADMVRAGWRLSAKLVK